MSAARCPSCGSPAEENARACWLCGSPLAATAGATEGASGSAGASTAPLLAVGSGSDATFWIAGFILSLLVIAAVGIDLGLIWPGLLVPYAVLVVPAVVVMTRIVYVQRFDFWRSSPSARTAPPAPTAAAMARAAAETRNRGDGKPAKSSGNEVVNEVLTAVAIGLVGLVAVMGLLFLLAIAAFVLLMAICFGMIAVMQ